MKAIIKMCSTLTHSKALKYPMKNIWETLRKGGKEAGKIEIFACEVLVETALSLGLGRG